MSGETPITIVGNLTADPELRFTPSGAAVANFTIASTPRKFDRQTNEWKDGDTLFMRCSIWRDAAENVVESLQRGMRVIAQGRLTMRSYQTKEGENRSVVELEVDEIGPSLRSATAVVKKAGRQQQQTDNGWGGAPQGPPRGSSGGNQPSDDPWTTGRSAQQQPNRQQPQQQSFPTPQQQRGWGDAPSYDEPPF